MLTFSLLLSLQLRFVFAMRQVMNSVIKINGRVKHLQEKSGRVCSSRQDFSVDNQCADILSEIVLTPLEH